MSKAESPDLTGLPAPTHRHPMSGEPIWDAAAVRKLVSERDALAADAHVLRVISRHAYEIRRKATKNSSNRVTKLVMDVRATTIASMELSLSIIRDAARDIETESRRIREGGTP